MIGLYDDFGSFKKYLRSHDSFWDLVKYLRNKFKFMGGMGCYYWLYVIGEWRSFALIRETSAWYSGGLSA